MIKWFKDKWLRFRYYDPYMEEAETSCVWPGENGEDYILTFNSKEDMNKFIKL